MFVGLESICFMLLVCSSFVLIVMVLIPLVQEKESGVKVRYSKRQCQNDSHLTQLSVWLLPMWQHKSMWKHFRDVEIDFSYLFQEFLRIASSFSYLNDVALFILAVLVLMLLWAIVYSAARCYDFLSHVDVCSMFLLTLYYVLSAVSFTFMVSVMFPSVFYAKVGSILAFSLSFLVYFLNREKTRWLMPFFNNALIVDTFNMVDSYGKRGKIMIVIGSVDRLK